MSTYTTASIERAGLQLLDVMAPRETTTAIVGTLLRVIGGDVAGELEFDLHSGQSRAWETPDLLLNGYGEDEVSAALAHHPALPTLRTGATLQPVRVTDLCGSTAWGRNPMRRELLDAQGVPFALLCGYTQNSGVVRGWGVNRQREFDERDVAAFKVLFPYLQGAAALRSTSQALADLDIAAGAGDGVVVLDQCSVRYSNEAARRMLDAHRLALPVFLRMVDSCLNRTRTAVVRTPRGLVRTEERPAAGRRRTVVLREVPPPEESARRLGLSERQRQVLVELTRGATASAISRRLGISARTVEKHIEAIYRHLGVRDRLAAVRAAERCGLLVNDTEACGDWRSA